MLKKLLKNKLALVGIAILLIGLPIVIWQTQRSQDVRQRAQTALTIDLRFNPESGTFQKGSNFTVDIIMDAGSHDVGSLALLLDYDQSKLSHISTTSDAYEILVDPSTSGASNLTVVNLKSSPVTGNSIKVVTFTFRADAVGLATVSLKPSIKSTATGVDNYLPLSANITNGVSGEYNITDPNITPPPAFSPTPATASPTPTGDSYCDLNPGGEACACTTNTQCQSGYCNLSIGTCGSPNLSGTPFPTITSAVSPTITQTPTAIPTNIPTPTVTLTPTATPTLPPGTTSLAFSISLPGIGSNAPVAGQGPTNNNETPITTIRQTEFILEDSSGADVTSLATGSNEPIKVFAIFDPITFTYKGTVDLGDTPTSNYIVKIRANNTLYKKAEGFPLITNGQENSLPSTLKLISGDIDRNGTSDNRITLDDYILFMACYKGKPICTATNRNRADLNNNGIMSKADHDTNLIEGLDLDRSLLLRGFLSTEGD